MPTNPPYMATPGLIPKILAKIEDARRPERFTQDFLETMLGFSGGSARAFIPLLKRMQFLSSDGTPTALYDQYRNADTRGRALAAGVRNAYSDVFERNTFAFNLPREKFASLVTEMTGLAKDSQVGKLIVSTFWTLKEGADFEGKLDNDVSANRPTVTPPADHNPSRTLPAESPPAPAAAPPARPASNDVQFRVGYTINLNLPETTNPEVFNAIFKSLKEHLLSE
jgi:Family of unknown function (DUF5343)